MEERGGYRETDYSWKEFKLDQSQTLHSFFLTEAHPTEYIDGFTAAGHPPDAPQKPLTVVLASRTGVDKQSSQNILCQKDRHILGSTPHTPTMFSGARW